MATTTVTTLPADVIDATRIEILGHAEDLFRHYGFGKTSMADIAGRCGMSPGNLYRYYRNKQAIGLAVADQFFAQSRNEIEASLLGISDPELRIRTILSASVDCKLREMITSPKVMELIDFLVQAEEAQPQLQAFIAWKRDKIMAELERGMEQGLFKEMPLYQTAVNFMHAVRAFLVPQCLATWKDPETIRPELDGVLDLIFMGVKA